ncbi:MAG TPA: 23S rRNA (uracil(1939)-C(5))-methyltransferase RlmD [Burkholderiales bacterium]|nr:23S rRNA (uracil(1939)-C(5))-methyltransferase RlmD [Burkholderiales bacterium]
MRAAARHPGQAPGAALAQIPLALEQLSIDSLDAEGRGVARNAEGKVCFVEGALPGERVTARLVRGKRSFDVLQADSILQPSASRLEPRCPHFGVCGGCVLQHADSGVQMAEKQRWLVENLARIGRVQPETLLPIVYGEEWGYRNRARLSVRRVEKKGGVLVGFRERRSTHVAEMRECHVLPQAVSKLIVPLRELIDTLSLRERLPQIEVAVGDNATALVFRHLLPLQPGDEAALRKFGTEHDIHVWLQPKGPDSAHPFHPGESDLYYELPEFGLKIHFRPTDFTQVNHAVNRILVSQALRMLDPQPGERVADLFCGLGNFSLPLAARGAQVVGFEGSRELVDRARQNAVKNGLVAQFEVMNLFSSSLLPYGPFEKILIDPPREGAIEMVKALPAAWPRRILYVSCDPATLARDAGVLVNVQGFRLAAAGVINMFPHTAHVESIALFER